MTSSYGTKYSNNWDECECYLDDSGVLTIVGGTTNDNGITRIKYGGDKTNKPWDGVNELPRITKIQTVGQIQFKASTDLTQVFGGCANLVTVVIGDGFDTTNVTNMSSLFTPADGPTTKLTSITFGKSFNTSNVISMPSMFNGCELLTSLDLSSFNTSKVQYADAMFQGCKALTKLDLSNLNFNKVTTFNQMFKDCTNLTEVIFNDGFDLTTSTITSKMFDGCTNLKTIICDNNITPQSYIGFN